MEFADYFGLLFFALFVGGAFWYIRKSRAERKANRPLSAKDLHDARGKRGSKGGPDLE